MIQVKRWLVRILTVMVAMMLVSCATPDYIPDQNVVKHMDVWKARHIVEKYLQHGGSVGRGILSGVTVPISSGRITPNEITILTGEGKSVAVPMKDIHITVFLGTEIIIFTKDHDMDSRIHLAGIPPGKVNDMASALFVLSRSGPKLRAMEDIELRFDATAKAYRDASPKPALPEAARRFKVQAEGAVNDKQFEDAAEYYEQAIEAAPWWPAGHFNRALVLGETKDYDLAIIEMKRYLALVPDAPDARAAQDKIYDWERKAAKSN